MKKALTLLLLLSGLMVAENRVVWSGEDTCSQDCFQKYEECIAHCDPYGSDTQCRAACRRDTQQCELACQQQ
jgi:hypothetical protein